MYYLLSGSENRPSDSRIHFGKVGQNGGMQNIGFMFIRYNTNQTITIEKY